MRRPLNEDEFDDLENMKKSKESIEIGNLSMDEIVPISFDNKSVNEILISSAYKITDFLQMDERENTFFSAEFPRAYLIHRFYKIWGDLTDIIVFDNVLDSDFFVGLIKNTKIDPKSYYVSYNHDQDRISLDHFILSLSNFVVYFDGTSTHIIYRKGMDQNKEGFLYKFYGLIKKYGGLSSKNESKIFVIFRDNYGFRKKSFPLNKNRVNPDLSLNYNDGFDRVSEEIISKLNDLNKSGLVILHGLPGTGKTTYLRYLSGKLNRNIIFIPPDMVSHITSPDFIPFLMDNSNSVLIIEDAEPALKKRDSGGRSGAVSNILNMTDGLLSDCLNISIVATFNTDMKDLDEALLRKGRLLKAYKFEKLRKEKSIELLKRLNKPYNIDKDMSLGEIYFNEDDNYSEEFETKRMKGFYNK